MCHVPTLKAELCATVALDSFYATSLIGSLSTEFTFGIGTPLDIFVLIGQRLNQPLPILLPILFELIQELAKYRMAHFEVAALLHAICVDTFPS